MNNPIIKMGSGAWNRMIDAMKLEAKVSDDVVFHGIKCVPSTMVPPNMAVMVGEDGECIILDMRTDEEKAA